MESSERSGQTHLFEHPVCLVENEHLDAVHGEARRVADVVDQSTGSRDDNVGALLQLGFLDFQGQSTCQEVEGRYLSALSASQ